MVGQKTLWNNAKLYTSQGVIENGSLLVGVNGCIEAVGQSELEEDEDTRVYDLKGRTVLPGFVDVHMHGGNGFNMMDGSYESLDGISKFHATHGTTSFLATTDSSANDKITQALKCVTESMQMGLSGAEVLGIHLEGPFLNLKRCGAQNKTEIRLPTPEEIHGFWDASQGLIKLVTLAPEIPGGLEAVKQFIGYGTTVSIGHSDATYDEVIQSIQAGASHTTHHFNGMSPLHHREPGVAGAGLMLPQLTTELIADGIHVHPALVKHLFDSKTPSHVCLITDAVQCAGLPNGDYGQVTMTDGQIYLKDGSSLAGSSLTMLQALKNVIQFTGYSIERILPSLTEVPARQIGMTHRKGSLQTGKDADFLVLDDALNLYSTFVKGKEVYNSSSMV